MAKNKRKSKKQKRLLLTSLLLALIIVIGGTFAWFTSKDEVTNHLSATNNFGVVIKENYTPTESLEEGQNITKEVGLLNTGSVDALARLKFSGTATMYYKTTTAYVTEGLSGTFAKLGSTIKKTTNTEGVVTVEFADPTDTNLNRAAAQAMQAGGKLVYEADTAVTKDVSSKDYVPSKAGLYIFERNDGTATGNDSDLGKYAGYYFDGTYYYMIEGANKDGSGVKLVNKACTVVSDLKVAYGDFTDGGTSKAATLPLTVTSGRDTVATVTLTFAEEAKYSNSTENSAAYTYDSKEWFYYNYVLDPGAATCKDLISTIKWEPDEDYKETYAYFDFDLNVINESVQAVYNDENRNQTAKSGQDLKTYYYNGDTSTTGYSAYYLYKQPAVSGFTQATKGYYNPTAETVICRDNYTVPVLDTEKGQKVNWALEEVTGN